MQLHVHNNELKQLIEQGNDCLKQKKQQQALLYFNSAVLLSPENIEALTACANILINQNRPSEAAIYTQRALQLRSDYSILTLHAQALYQMGRYVEALECFERITTLQPNNYVAMNQRALCLTQVNRYQEADQLYQQALVGSNRQDPWIHYNYSLCLLAMGKLLHGFSLYEYRWLCSLIEKRCAWKMPAAASREALHNKSILVQFEQGLGDTIQFFRYIPLLVQLGARVSLEIQSALIPLFSTWRNAINFIAAGSPLPSCDYHCSMMSLPGLFKTEMHTIPSAIPYVFPNMDALETCQKKLGYSNHKRIGISWNGSTSNPINQKRSIALSNLLTLYQPHLDFICLQKDISLNEKNELDKYNVAYHGLELSTMAGTAALIACLDIVITIDTSIAHLAGAMGKEVWILLPYSADWRWFLQRDDSPWYPNAKLFRQEAQGDWSVPLARIKNALLTSQATINIPTSIGDLIDRITILKLKSDKIKNDAQLNHVRTELSLLISAYNKIKVSLNNHDEIHKLENKLMQINTQLWGYEDQIRQQTHDADIAKTAKSIIQTNDLRSATKYAINSLLDSCIVEEKSYAHSRETT